MVEYQVDGLPAGASLDPRSGVMTWLPPADVDRVQLTVRVVLRDGRVLTGEFLLEPHTGRLLEFREFNSTQVQDAGLFSEQLAHAADQFNVEVERLKAALVGS